MPLKTHSQHVKKAKKWYKEQGNISIAFIQRKFQLNFETSKLIYEKVISSSLHNPEESKQPFCLDKPQKIRQKNKDEDIIPYKNYGPPKLID